MNEMIYKPIIPIVYMAVICVALLLLKRKGVFAFLRQFIIVLLLFAINLRPMIPNGEITTQKQQLDAAVIFVIDNTVSMLAEDYGEGDATRMDGVRMDCRHIVTELTGASFAAMVFNNKANRLTPFTDEEEYLFSIIDSIKPMSEIYARGSDLNIGKPMLKDMLADASGDENKRVIVFFLSDGEITNEKKLESFSELAPMIDYGAVLGYGTEKGGRMHAETYDGMVELVTDYSNWDDPDKAAISRIDEKNLKQIADDLGVSYIPMGEPSRLDSLLNSIRKDTAGEVEEDSIEGYTDIYYYFAIALFAMLLLEMILYRRKER